MVSLGNCENILERDICVIQSREKEMILGFLFVELTASHRIRREKPSTAS